MAPMVARIGRALVSFEPAQAAAEITVPVLVLQGEKDVQVDPAENAERLVAARRSAGKPVDYHRSPLADHVLKTEPRPLEEVRADLQLVMAKYNSPDRALDNDLLEALARWIRDH
jgi:dipeptidyl aminopeptidase/acylaminoacyl peptidase